MKKNILFGAGVVLVGAGIAMLFANRTPVLPEAGKESVPPAAGEMVEAVGVEGSGGLVMTKNYTVVFTEAGFTPKELAIKKGETVTFVNESAGEVWPASAMHPTHTGYPGSDFKKCGTAEQGTIFDACAGIKPGASWSFTFNEVGAWRYHDHMNAKNTGLVGVSL